MLKRVLFVAIAGLLSLLVCAAGFASSPVIWETSKQEDVAKGDARGVSINENGAVTLAPTFTLVYDTKEAYVWSSAVDQQGNIYLGTGHAGRVFRVDKSGAGKLLYKAAELDVTALAPDDQGNVFAATSPDGKIYKITADGAATVFFSPGTKYIWSLAYDRPTSTLFAGTGSKGAVYKIDAAGKGAVLANTTEANVVSIALAKNGDVIAGTEPSGLVLRVSPSGKTFALLDSPLQEIHKLQVAADGSIYALGINSQAGGAAKRSGTVGVSSTTAISSEGVITVSSDDSDGVVQAGNSSADVAALLGQSKAQSKNSAEGAKSAVFHIMADGASEISWTSRDAVGFGLDVLPDGKVLVGTGNKGRIYSVGANRLSTLLIQSPEDQTSTLLTFGNEVYATSSNLGKLYRVGRQLESAGTYTSPVRDAKFAAAWGVIGWRGMGPVELQTRTGNTDSPDSTWSDWSAPYRNPAGEQITSPKARFIQWRATLKAGEKTSEENPRGANFQAVTVAFLPRNQAPEITAAGALPPGVSLQEVPIPVDPGIASSGLDPSIFGVSVNVPPRRFFQKGARSLVWQASDPNDDPLVYRLSYRALGDDDWHLLADNLTQSYFTIDGNRLPDGPYIFKVQASDSPGNPEGSALTAELLTDVIEIDNTPPAVKAGQARVNGLTAEVTFDAADATSRVVKGEFSLDGGPWQLVFPVDGIADSPKETFKVTARFARTGEHVIAFRCADSSANVGTSKVTVTVR